MRAKWLAARAPLKLITCAVLSHRLHFAAQPPQPWSSRTKRLLCDLLFRTSAASLLELARDPKHLGADIGFLGVLHTWGQNLEVHPHIHYIVPAGGLALRWFQMD